MSDERWIELMNDPTAKSKLTKEEMDEGWHFCFDWDGLLVGPDMSELEACTCKKTAGQPG